MPVTATSLSALLPPSQCNFSMHVFILDTEISKCLSVCLQQLSKIWTIIRTKCWMKLVILGGQKCHFGQCISSVISITDAGGTSPIFWLGDVNGNIPQYYYIL